MTFKKKIIRAASWVMIGHVTSQLFRLVSNLIMTRLLVPEMFGIMVIANVFMTGIAMISDVGIKQHLIQSKNSGSVIFINTAWTAQIIRGGVLWGLALITSGILVYIAEINLLSAGNVYAEPILPYVIAVLSFNAAINGFESTKMAMAHRNLAQNIVVKIELVSQFSGILTMVTWAYIDKTIWALVVGTLVSTILKVVLTHTSLPGINNKLCWDKTSFYELFHFGKWIFLTSIIGFLSIHSDKIILGGLINANLLGIYAIAVFIVGAFRSVIEKIIRSVAYPVLSEVMRERPQDLKDAYYKMRLPIDLVVFFLVGFLYVAGETIIALLYDERYMQAGRILEILSLILLAERYSLTNQCFMAMGKPKLLVPTILLRVVFLYMSIPFAHMYYGLNGVIWSITISSFIALPVIYYLKAKYLLLDYKKEIFPLIFILPGYFLGIGIIYLYR